jgi:ParB family chromosome partitioning protein
MISARTMRAGQPVLYCTLAGAGPAHQDLGGSMGFSAPIVEMIPLDRINVINPRVRNKRDFEEVVSNIDRLGLKRPVTVTRREHPDGLRYDLVCGQGRVEAYLALKQTEIPALVIEASPEECLVKSLVENCARRHHRAVDLLRGIECLRRRGHSDAEIARKTDLSQEYVRGVFRLLEKGEHRLLRAVEAEQIPVSVAVEIADTDDAGTQRALQQAYEKNLLRGHRLLAAKRAAPTRQGSSQHPAQVRRPGFDGRVAACVPGRYRQEEAVDPQDGGDAEPAGVRGGSPPHAARRRELRHIAARRGAHHPPEKPCEQALAELGGASMTRSSNGGRVRMAFEQLGVTLALADIKPLREVSRQVRRSPKYAQIAASIREVGLVELPIVVRDFGELGKYLLLDGHLRIAVLLDMGVEEVVCLVSTDDEAFTYNRRVNRIAIVQEHKMMLKAIERGVSAERLARALNVNVAEIRRKRRLLDNVCPEAAELLKDRFRSRPSGSSRRCCPSGRSRRPN